jgi:hypothetical protein
MGSAQSSASFADSYGTRTVRNLTAVYRDESSVTRSIEAIATHSIFKADMPPNVDPPVTDGPAVPSTSELLEAVWDCFPSPNELAPNLVNDRSAIWLTRIPLCPAQSSSLVSREVKVMTFRLHTDNIKCFTLSKREPKYVWRADDDEPIAAQAVIRSMLGNVKVDEVIEAKSLTTGQVQAIYITLVSQSKRTAGSRTNGQSSKSRPSNESLTNPSR